ncbi:nucleotidyltransferase [Cohnella soli]|uniref:Nucleotidyltransferase n=1 Tax=Cohnella soli TaxID=425005 RepID=A0ABW0HMC7_9BACL
MNFDINKLPRHPIFCIDIKSAYASIECVMRGLDPLTTYLAVVGDLSRKGSVVLAASPPMKKDYGIKTGSRLYEIPTNDSRIHVVQARMGKYLDYAMQVPRILKRFMPMECISIYSVDELFATYDHSLFGDKWTAARTIQSSIKLELGLPSAIGIGENYFQSKICLDLMAKKNVANNYIDEVTYETFAEKLWHFPVKDCWGIGSRMEKNLAQLGIFNIGELAKANMQSMKSRFGVIGQQMVLHASGIDYTNPYYRPEMSHNAIVQKGFGSGITLMRDYMKRDEIITAILDQTEIVASRAREARVAGRTINLAIGYSDDMGGGGFSKDKTIATPTNLTHRIFQVCKEIFQEKFSTSAPVRRIHVGLTNLSPDEIAQLDLFEDDTKERQIAAAMDRIRNRFGAASITWARSITAGGTAIDRAGKIGGHKI